MRKHHSRMVEDMRGTQKKRSPTRDHTTLESGRMTSTSSQSSWAMQAGASTKANGSPAPSLADRGGAGRGRRRTCARRCIRRTGGRAPRARAAGRWSGFGRRQIAPCPGRQSQRGEDWEREIGRRRAVEKTSRARIGGPAVSPLGDPAPSDLKPRRPSIQAPIRAPSHPADRAPYDYYLCARWPIFRMSPCRFRRLSTLTASHQHEIEEGEERR